MNTYLYVNAEPIQFIDPFGLATQREVEAAVQTLMQNYPSEFKKQPNSVAFDENLNGLGRTDWNNNITMNGKRFGDPNTCVRQYDEYQFMQTMAHEMSHVNENFVSRVASNSFRMGNPLGYYHRKLDERADSMINKKIIEDYIKKRGSRKECGCD